MNTDITEEQAEVMAAMTNDNKQPDVREALQLLHDHARLHIPQYGVNQNVFETVSAALQSPSVANDGWKPTHLEVLAWNDRNGGWFQGRLDEARCAIDDARSMHLIAAPPQPPQQQEQSGEAWAWANAFVMELIENHDWMGTGSVESGERDKKAALAKWAAILSDTHPPTATASQESAPGQEAIGMVVTFADGTTVFRKAGESFPPTAQSYSYVPVYTAPLNADLLVGAALHLIRGQCETIIEYADDSDPVDSGRIHAAKGVINLIEALTPANAEAELAALMMKIAKAAQKNVVSLGSGANTHCDDDDGLRAIVRRVLDEWKGIR